jgi:ferritin-like metal-binding protein YciE
MSDLSVRESKLVQYLNEAYGKEKELETALVAHIGMTTRDVYRKRLREHLTETKRHARELERRVKQLGGAPQTVPIEGFDPLAKGAAAAVGLAGRAAAAAQGPLHAIRGTGEQEKMLKNAKSEYADEHEEIATYSAIETLAEALGDIDTAKLARAIRREEQSMARFLERQIQSLTKAVVQEEIPASQRRSSRSTTKRRRTATAKRSATGTAKRSGTAGGKRSGTGGAKRSATSAAKRTGGAKRPRSKGTARSGTRAGRSAA